MILLGVCSAPEQLSTVLLTSATSHTIFFKKILVIPVAFEIFSVILPMQILFVNASSVLHKRIRAVGEERAFLF